jgi:hypothetical protein
MKRFHVHVGVKDPNAGVQFYSTVLCVCRRCSIPAIQNK